jgi:tetratricopeptide (TPR) repeat protein
MNSECPPRVKLLALITAGEHVPHLDTCEECATFVAAATEAVTAFRDRSELEAAVRSMIDELIAETPSHRWGIAIFSSRTLHRSVVIRDLLRRADEQYGSDPRSALEFTSTAMAICDAMAKGGQTPSAELRFEVLKAHSSILREIGSLDEALSVLGRAWSVADETEERELYHAIVSLCAATLYAEPDLARFDEAIDLAESAAAVLDICGDQRRAVIARHTKAYALVAMKRFEAAVPLLRGVVAEIVEAGGGSRDAALAHVLLGLCLVRLGSYSEAIDHARIAEHLHEKCGDTVDAARAAHVAARALAGMGHFGEARDEFTRTAEIVFCAGLFDVWCLLRLDYIAAALADDESADVRTDVEAVARVCMTVATRGSTRRQQFAAEALDYLRRLALRDAITSDVVNHVRMFVERNTSGRPVRFAPPAGAAFVM